MYTWEGYRTACDHLLFETGYFYLQFVLVMDVAELF